MRCASPTFPDSGCANDVSEHVYGTQGEAHMDGSRWSIKGEHEWTWAGANNDPYQTEHDDFFASIRTGKPLNEGQMVAESTLTAILGRMATYSGREVTWEKALNSDEKWGPDSYEFGPAAGRSVADAGPEEGLTAAAAGPTDSVAPAVPVHGRIRIR